MAVSFFLFFFMRKYIEGKKTNRSNVKAYRISDHFTYGLFAYKISNHSAYGLASKAFGISDRGIAAFRIAFKTAGLRCWSKIFINLVTHIVQ